MSGDLDALVAQVLASARHRNADPGLVARIGSRELAAHRTQRAAVKATKTRLHQILGAFWLKRPRYDAWFDDLRAAAGSDDALRAQAFEIMRRHASTAERLEYLDGFYESVFAGLVNTRAVLDLGCGLNPLARPWMPLPAGTRYHAYDADHGLVGFLDRWLQTAGVGTASACDLVAGAPPVKADVALLLKLLPSLESVDPDAPGRLLDSVRAPTLVVSYAAASLSGTLRYRDVAGRFAGHAGPLAEGAEEHHFPGEVVFVVRR